MKIAIVRQRYTPYGGAERFVARAIKALQERAVDVTLITRHWQGQESFNVVSCNPFYLGRLWRDWGFARSVCRQVRGSDYHLVQSHERIACCDVYRAGDGVHREWLAQRRRVMDLPGRLGLLANPYHHYVLGAERRLFASSRLKAVICNSYMVRGEIQTHFGVPDHKLHVVHSGVDTSAYSPQLAEQHRAPVRRQWGIPEDAPLLLFVGSGFERKGLPAALAALRHLAGDTHLLVVGKDKKLAAFQRGVRQQGLEARVHFAGAQRDVKPFYGAADAFVLPTLYDPFPNAVLEAMASGLPALISNKCGAVDIVKHETNGWICDALDIGSIARGLELLCSPGQRSAMGEAARTTVEGLDLATMSERYVQLYWHLLEQSRAQ